MPGFLEGDLNISDLVPSQQTPLGTSTFDTNNLITQISSVIKSIWGKSPTTTSTTTPTGSTTTTAGLPDVIIDDKGGKVLGGVNMNALTTKAWFWPLVIILLVIVFFGKRIKRLFR